MTADDSASTKESGTACSSGAQPQGIRRVQAQGTVRTRMNMSIPHLLAACRFSRKVGELETAHHGKKFSSFWEGILANATASIFLTVAALESYANELFADRDKIFHAIPREILWKLWEVYGQKPILDKFELALLLRSEASMNRGTLPAQDVALLIRLRNVLVHFKPEWFDEQDDHAKLAGQLAGRFTPSPFFGNDEPLFPRGWASHDCTKWAINSAINFVETIEHQAGLPPRLDRFKTRLTP